MGAAETLPPDVLARRRAAYLAGLWWHAGSFVIVNGLLWFLDAVAGQGGIQWAFWITAFWGVGLAFHVLAYLVEGRQLQARKTQEYLAQQSGDGSG